MVPSILYITRTSRGGNSLTRTHRTGRYDFECCHDHLSGKLTYVGFKVGMINCLTAIDGVPIVE
jgi:hypothetical protein